MGGGLARHQRRKEERSRLRVTRTQFRWIPMRCCPIRSSKMFRVTQSIFLALAPTAEGSNYDRFSHRWSKFWFCVGGVVMSTALLASSLKVLEERTGTGTALEWLGPALFGIGLWLALGQAWLYYTLRHPRWSGPYMWIWWRTTGRTRDQ